MQAYLRSFACCSSRTVLVPATLFRFTPSTVKPLLPPCASTLLVSSMGCPGSKGKHSRSPSPSPSPSIVIPPRVSPVELLAPAAKKRKVSQGSAIAISPAQQQSATAASVKSKPSPAAPAKQQESKGSGPWLIVGLGNPGELYAKSRHNVGFMVVDELAKREGIDCRKVEKRAVCGHGELFGKRLILAKPSTYMNLSGECVGALAKFYKTPTNRILVISDDLDSPCGAVKLKQKGGHGGHNGLRSIIEELSGCQDFPRLKIGIGRPTGPMPIASYVLQSFSKHESEHMAVALQEATTVVKSVLALGLDKALSGQRIPKS